MSCLVMVHGTGDGRKTPHDERYIVDWNPHTEFGTCEANSTSDPLKARRFKDAAEVLAEWKAISNFQRIRPDGKPNRPLSGLTIEIIKEPKA